MDKQLVEIRDPKDGSVRHRVLVEDEKLASMLKRLGENKGFDVTVGALSTIADVLDFLGL